MGNARTIALSAVLAGVTHLGCGSVSRSGGESDAAVPDGPQADAAPSCVKSPAGLGGRWRGEMNLDDQVAGHAGTPVANVGYAPGKHGFAFLLDGVNSLVTINDGDTLWPAGSFSIEAWVKTTATGEVVSKYQCGDSCPSNTAGALWDLQITPEGRAAFLLRADASEKATLTDSLHDVHDGQWHHLVGVRDVPGGSLSLYVDGALAVTAPLTTAQAGALTNTDGEIDVIVIGGIKVPGMATFERKLAGAIDEVSYYSSEMSAAQVAAIYRAADGECP